MARPILEAAVESAEAAAAAERAGAARVELCVRLDTGGVTPPPALTSAAIARVSIPVFVMIRPRPGGFVYTAEERAVMLRQIASAVRARAAGLVAGVLDAGGRIDVTATQEIVAAANGLPVTFHRAFDETPNLMQALEDVVAAGASRVLTAGGTATAADGAGALADLVRGAADRLTIVAAGGVRAHNVAALVARTGVREVHARFEDEARTRQLVDLL